MMLLNKRIVVPCVRQTTIAD